MKDFIVGFICVIYAITCWGQGVTKHGEISVSGNVFIDQYGRLQSIPHLDQYGRIIDTETQVVEVMNPTTGKTWMDRNLGASRAATSSTDADAYGDLYQWGRVADGHQKRTSGTTSTLSSSDTPGHGSFIINYEDWRSPPSTNLWQGVNGINNPCPPGYRLPTEAEFNAERLSWSSDDSAGAFASPLKLPVAGIRYYSDGTFNNVGSFGYFWSSTVDKTYSRFLLIASSSASVSGGGRRASGRSVRCFME